MNNRISAKNILSHLSRNKGDGYLGYILAALGKDLDALIPTEAKDGAQFLLCNLLPRSYSAYKELRGHILCNRLLHWHGKSKEAEALKRLMESVPYSTLWEQHENFIPQEIKIMEEEEQRAKKFKEQEARTDRILEKARR